MPLEDTIRNSLIPALLGRPVSPIERRILAMPYRFGGMGIRDPSKTADIVYQTSCEVTKQLTDMIVNQDRDLSTLDRDMIKQAKSDCKAESERLLKEEAEDIANGLDDRSRKLFEGAREKGASAWLSALPIRKYGYIINKQEFRDAVALRYGWKIDETPEHCGCGSKNSFDHIFTCKKGGYVSMRHNAIRDTEAKLLKEVCKDIKIEPSLIPTDADVIHGNVSENARLDISAIGIWSQYQKTFMDVRVTHPTADSHIGKTAEALYSENEREKKSKYNERIINTEKATFTPLVFSTSGGMAPECTKLNKRIAELISLKTGEAYSHVMRFIRTRLLFALLRTSLIAIRGTRGSYKSREECNLAEVSYNLIPQAVCE